MDKTILAFEFKDGRNNDREYNVETICDSKVFTRESHNFSLGLYYLIFWKDYLEKENTWKLASTVQYFGKRLSTYHNKQPEKLTVISTLLDSGLVMAKPRDNLAAKRK